VSARYRHGHPIYVVELRHPKSWRLTCGVSGDVTAFTNRKDAAEYVRMADGRRDPMTGEIIAARVVPYELREAKRKKK